MSHQSGPMDYGENEREEMEISVRISLRIVRSSLRAAVHAEETARFYQEDNEPALTLRRQEIEITYNFLVNRMAALGIADLDPSGPNQIFYHVFDEDESHRTVIEGVALPTCTKELDALTDSKVYHVLRALGQHPAYGITMRQCRKQLKRFLCKNEIWTELDF